MAGDSIVWNIGTLTRGTQTEVSFLASIPAMTAGGTLVANQAQVIAAELADPVLSDDPATSTEDDPTVFAVEAAPSLVEGTKRVVNLAEGVVKPGDTLEYTITVKNSGNTWASNVVVNDEIDITHLEEIQPSAGGIFTGTSVYWDSTTTQALALIGLSPNGDVSLSFTARVKQDVADGTIISNQAVFACDQQPGPVPSDDPATATPDDPTQVRVVAAPLFVSSRKEVIDLDGGLVEPGDILEYTILVVNNGSQTANGTIVRDSIPARASYLPGSTVLNGSPLADQPGGLSPLVEGLRVKSARAGTPDGVLWIDDGSGTSDAVAVVNFRVRVEAAGVVCG
ncbi:MAG: DUF11 domain-containing protein, partial [Deltaproteobacteria bacterium]|nr:DUF11 domain-containing protein [Deltaproteobacteria bacterium]